ncbi:MAG: RluA family pseudouridine synthase [Hylemonella sp.]|nr:RluA family pseudouridine synthase [Hylemonella sp.]MDH5707886.1 RluA family pseudouridine synthase [Hylemonella sp.]
MPVNPASDPGARAIAVLHADESLLVLDKPAGLLSVPGRGPDKQDCLSARVQGRFADAQIVHRLDMATSGLLLMARGAQIQRSLSQAFARREVAKRYIAVVDGRVDVPANSWHDIDLPILADWERRPLRIIDAQGQPSLTRWRLLAHETDALGGPCSRLELEPVTGRTHQLRVHLQALGHPILGDALYAPPAVQIRSDRLLLHACTLTFEHPGTGKALNFRSEPSF